MSKEYSLEVSFRLDRTRFASDYDERYENLKDKIVEFAIADDAWMDSTSTIFLKTHHDPTEVAKALAAGLHRSHDVLLVQIVGQGVAFLFGDTANATHLQLISGLTVLPV